MNNAVLNIVTSFFHTSAFGLSEISDFLIEAADLRPSTQTSITLRFRPAVPGQGNAGKLKETMEDGNTFSH